MYKILFVDDEPYAHANVRRFFGRKHHGVYEIESAHSADEAIAAVRRENGNFAVAVTDFVMPGETGTDLLILLQKEYPSIRRVLVTAQFNKDELGEHLESGAIELVMIKPIELEDLASCITQLINGTEINS